MTEAANLEVKQYKLSYFESLNEVIKKRYREKISFLKDTDPYLLKKTDFKYLDGQESTFFHLLPPLAFPDIYMYLISGESPFTHKSLKNYKALEAYDQFVCGFLRNIGVKTFGEEEKRVVLIKCQVMHSQRLREKLLEPWVIVGSDGAIHSGHCTCMAGLDECCTHIAALLFYIEYAVRFRETVSVTGEKAYWVVPTTKEPKYSPVSQMDLTSAKAKKKTLEALLEGGTPAKPKTLVRKPTKEVPDFSKEEMDDFWNDLHEKSPNSAILRVHPKFYHEHIPMCIEPKTYPPVLTELYDDALTKLSFGDLLAHSEMIDVSFSKEQAKKVEEETKLQAKSKSWHRFRAGRITASNLRQACHTNTSMPSVSLIQTICYPGSRQFENESTRWGIRHEKTMKNIYLRVKKETRVNFKLEESGLFLNSLYPHLGASPDGIVECNCCGKGVLEIKCPYSMRFKSVKEVNPKFCLENTVNGLKLKRDHAYYHQIQAQIFLSERSYGDFCVWTTVDHHIERVEQDQTLWEDVTNITERLFRTAILPELLSQYFTSDLEKEKKRLKLNTSGPQTSLASPAMKVLSPSKTNDKNLIISDDVERWCYCKEEEKGKMIFCEFENCAIKWFHTKCLKMRQIPKRKWFCPDCKKIDRAGKIKSKVTRAKKT